MDVPEVPIGPVRKRVSTVATDTSETTDTLTVVGDDFVPRTLKTTAIVVATAVLCLVGTGKIGWVIPFVGGALLGAILLIGMEWLVRRSFAPETVLAARGIGQRIGEDGIAPAGRKKKFGGKGAILVFALIKYPAVALLLWWIARHLTRVEIAAFISGFVLLQISIGLRGLGAFLFPARTKSVK